MSHEIIPWAIQPEQSGTIVASGEDFYAMFQRYPGAPTLAGDEALAAQGGIYNYGIIKTVGHSAEPNTWTLDRTIDENRLVPHTRTRLDLLLRGNTLVVPEMNVAAALELMQPSSVYESGPPLAMPAEQLYKRWAGRRLGGKTIDACATVGNDDYGRRLTYIDKLGGYCVGVPAMAEPPQRVAPRPLLW